MNLSKPNMDFLEASTTPKDDIEKIAYSGQDPLRKMYRSGYELYMDIMPVLRDNDPQLDEKIKLSKDVMHGLAEELHDSSWVREMEPEKNGFNRTILAIAPPKVTAGGSFEEGPEFVLAKWGDGHTSPVHGHSVGYMHEDIIFGKMRVNTYRMTSPSSKVVRPISVQIVEKGTFVSSYNPKDIEQQFKRQSLVHNFTSIGFSASLHYLPEHTRDGRDNQFVVEFFDDFFEYDAMDFRQITGKEAMYARKGDVILVRSLNVPEYGDHYIVITGAPVMKEHGLRPQDVAIPAPTNILLDKHEPKNGVILLKLNDRARVAFHKFHDISLNKGEVVFPTA